MPYHTDLNVKGFAEDSSLIDASLHKESQKPTSSLLMKLGVLAGLFALATLLQLLSGVFSSEFGAYPDEPAHYVTSLMLREYITGPHPLGPLRFAEQYYLHYPKVAFGHWPPVFYIVQAFWMLLFSASRISVRLELAFTTALLAFSVWKEALQWFGKWAALLAATLLVCLPLVQDSTDEEMAETLLVLFCFWSTIYFGRFLASGKRSDSLWFGLYFSLAVLTKGSGWLLVFVPPIAILLTRKFRVLLNPSFWIGVALTAVLCLPWQLLTLHSAERGWTGGSKPSVGYTITALGKFLQILIGITGPVLSILILLGIVVSIWSCWKRPVHIVPAVMLALLVGDWVFHSLVPAGVETRKMILAVPALIHFLFAGGIWLANRLPLTGPLGRWRSVAVALPAAVIFALTVFSIPRANVFGYIPAAKFITGNPGLEDRTLLVSSQSGGEGLLISEVAMCQPRPKAVIVRATKAFAAVDWTGEHYRSLVTQPSEVLAYLAKQHVAAVVTDTHAGQVFFPHQQLLERTIAANPARFRLVAAYPGRGNAGTGQVHIYAVEPSPLPK